MTTTDVPTSTQSRLALLQWIIIGLLVVASVTTDAIGRSALSWIIDGVAVGVYLAFRAIRARNVPTGNVT